MRRITAGAVLAAGVLAVSGTPVFSQEQAAEAPESALIDQTTLPDAIDQKGGRPQADPSVLPPAATELPAGLQPLAAPPTLALPNQPDQVRIHELRPLTLEEALQLAEVNSPSLKAVASQVDQAKSALRAEISLWYPTIDLQANGLPEYFKSYTYQNPDFVPDRIVQKNTGQVNPFTGEAITTPVRKKGKNELYGRQWRTDLSVQVAWDIIDPARVPRIAAARDNYELVQDSYLIALRELRLQISERYFALQLTDEQVRIGQASVRASLVSLRDARARYNAGVNTKLEVLEAETQLARDRNLLTQSLAEQATARRLLANLLDLPQDITPTAATPAAPLGLWEPSLQESIIAAYNYREELDQLILDISIDNSQANAALAAVQPVLGFVNTTTTFRNEGQTNRTSLGAIDMDDFRWGVQNTTALTARWRLFDGGSARAEYRRLKQAADESAYNFARERDAIRFEVEQSFIGLREQIQNIETMSSEVLTARESLRLAQLRVQAGVATQREVVDSQRDLTNAQLRYANAIQEYNIRLAQLRRRTGLDALIACPATNRPADKPAQEGTDIPIEPRPLKTACPTALASGMAIGSEAQPVQPLW